MNKKELIEKIEALPDNIGLIRPHIDKKLVLGLVRELDEPQKVVVPAVVSVWYLINKDNLYKNIAYLCANWVKSTTDDTLFDWMSNNDNFIEILFNMHKFGYEVEEKKRYEVILCNGQSLKTVYRQGGDRLDFEKEYGDLESFTRKQLEEAGFGWVFDCPGIEVREVE